MTFSKSGEEFSEPRAGKYPSRKQWWQFFKAPRRFLGKKERILFFVFLATFLGSLFFLSLNFYFKNTEIVPVQGGVFVEGLLGQPRWINPIYARVSDVDRDLTELIFSGLTKYDKEGKIVPDLAQNYEIKEGGKIYEIYLKEKLFWQDGVPLTADDVVFTIKTIQNSDYKSPLLINWLGVEIEKISDLEVRFKLKNPYGSFLENLTQKIIPEHVFKDVPPENFSLSVYNLKPTGSGPYKLKELKQGKDGKIISLDLIRNSKYFGKTPAISQLTFRFFNQEEELIKAYKKGQIQGFSLTSLNNNLNNNLNSLPKPYSFYLPRYFAVFFNPDPSTGGSKLLTDQNVRQALNYGTDKSEIVNKALSGYAKVVDSPILPEIYGYSNPSKIYQFNLEKAKDLLEKSGFIEGEGGKRMKITEKEPAFQFKTDLKEGSKGKEVENLQRCLANPPTGGPEIYPEAEITSSFGKSTKAAVIRFQEKYAKDILEPWGLKQGSGIVSKNTRDKLNEVCFPRSKDYLPLKLSLSTVNQPVLIKVANLLKEQWAKLGAELEIKTFDISRLEKEQLKQRNYEGLLLGQVLTMIPDPFSFWHSAQKKDPGLNLAIYQNKKADKLLEEARQTANEKERKEKLEKLQDILIEDAPAVFLYNPDYLYFVSDEIKGVKGGIIVDSSKRFADIENWYIKTTRAWK
jgi:ABC-type transport system substrate-binding protein